MKIRLISLILENFKGIEHFELDADGNNISVLGTNASGKTTLADAYFWLLFGKDSNGAANFDVKTIGTTGLDYSVTATIDVDGKQHTLRRTLNEKWERKHGETEKRLKGNTTTYIIDSVPVKEKEYKSFIETELVDEKTYQMLTDPDFFAGKTDWKKRRAKLLEWFADITDEEIISAHKNLAELPDILDGKTAENARKALQVNQKTINDLLKAIPSRIDEQQKNITKIEDAYNGDEQENLDRLLKEKAHLEEESRKAGTNDNLTKAESAVEAAKLAIARERTEYAESCREINKYTDQMLFSLRKEGFKLQCEISDRTDQINVLNRKLEQISEKGKSYNEQFKAISEESYTGSDICPCCGQFLPQERIQSAIEEFNRNKSERLEKIKNDCAALKAERTEVKNRISQLEDDIKILNEKQNRTDSDIKELAKELIEPKPFEETDKYKELSELLKKAEDVVLTEKSKIEENPDAKIARLKARIDEVDRQCEELRLIIARYNTIDTYRSRIEELKKQESEYGKLLAKADKDIMLIDEFIKTKCSEVEKIINSHFRLVKWKLFDLQVNGGINDCCEATVDGVDYSTNLNSAAKLNAGLDIITTISGVTDIYVPIWIDNAESVVRYIDTKSQTIKLVVSEEYQTLTVKE